MRKDFKAGVGSFECQTRFSRGSLNDLSLQYYTPFFIYKLLYICRQFYIIFELLFSHEFNRKKKKKKMLQNVGNFSINRNTKNKVLLKNRRLILVINNIMENVKDIHSKVLSCSCLQISFQIFSQCNKF